MPQNYELIDALYSTLDDINKYNELFDSIQITALSVLKEVARHTEVKYYEDNSYFLTEVTSHDVMLSTDNTLRSADYRIPIEVIIDKDARKKYIDDIIEKEKETLEREMREHAEMEQKKFDNERKLYERLKRKFEGDEQCH